MTYRSLTTIFITAGDVVVPPFTIDDVRQGLQATFRSDDTRLGLIHAAFYLSNRLATEAGGTVQRLDIAHRERRPMKGASTFEIIIAIPKQPDRKFIVDIARRERYFSRDEAFRHAKIRARQEKQVCVVYQENEYSWRCRSKRSFDRHKLVNVQRYYVLPTGEVTIPLPVDHFPTPS